VQNPLRRRNRALTAEQQEEVQKLVFELVRERLASAFGPRGMWSVNMKDRDAVDAIFAETVSESLAWDVATQLAPPKKSRHQAAAETKASRQQTQPVVTVQPTYLPAAGPVIVEESAREERLVA
jgi:hypothetical protein